MRWCSDYLLSRACSVACVRLRWMMVLMDLACAAWAMKFSARPAAILHLADRGPVLNRLMASAQNLLHRQRRPTRRVEATLCLRAGLEPILDRRGGAPFLVGWSPSMALAGGNRARSAAVELQKRLRASIARKNIPARRAKRGMSPVPPLPARFIRCGQILGQGRIRNHPRGTPATIGIIPGYISLVSPQAPAANHGHHGPNLHLGP